MDRSAVKSVTLTQNSYDLAIVRFRGNAGVFKLTSSQKAKVKAKLHHKLNE